MKTSHATVKAAFDRAARDYDRARRQLVPCFDEFYGAVLGKIPFGKWDEFRLLDLGAGTGLLSAMLASAFPGADLTLMDISGEMLEKAEERLAELEIDAVFVTGDYSEEMPSGFDVIVSALSIHHLDHPTQADLYRRIFAALDPGGVFIHADQVLGETPEVERNFQEAWLREARALGVSDADLAAALERQKQDRSAKLDDQLAWLRKAGFTDVTCSYRNSRFAVCSGRKV